VFYVVVRSLVTRRAPTSTPAYAAGIQQSLRTD
jgi:hypothetical protein